MENAAQEPGEALLPDAEVKQEGTADAANIRELGAMEESGPTLTLRQIRRILNDSRDGPERRRAAQELLPRLWDKFPWNRYAAGCTLTTRVYLPSTLLWLEWGSFPNVLTRELRRNNLGTLPPTPHAQREALTRTLGEMLKRWHSRYIRASVGKRGEANINFDIAADVCEAIGRLGIAQAEHDLLDVIVRFDGSSNQVRSAALLALAALPPEEMTQTWEWLQSGTQRQQRMIGDALAYMTLPGAVPFLLQSLPGIASNSALQTPVGMPLLLALGRIGDPRALPDLNTLARNDRHPLQPTARKAIKILMKEAEGHEEVTLVRASGASSVPEDTLLRPSSEAEANLYPEQLLRASTPQTQSQASTLPASTAKTDATK